MGKRRSSADMAGMRERMGRFCTLMGVVGALVGGVLIWQWIASLSTDALALAGGVILGIVVMSVPLAFTVLGGWIVLRWLNERRDVRPQVLPAPQPPVVIVSGGQMWPGQLPSEWQAQTYPPMLEGEELGNGQRAPRSFSVIGED